MHATGLPVKAQIVEMLNHSLMYQVFKTSCSCSILNN